jgi:ABC-2 type transport system ATP-binding protein
MIEVERLVKRYGRVQAVRGVSFAARAGELRAILGPNGAGKSTTLKMITGLIRPTSGRVRLAGYDVARQGRQAKARLGYVPDRPYLYPKLTARELLRFLARLRQVEAGEREAERWLETFGLLEQANELIETYSHGMRQKLTFAAALLHQPPVLVIDEPMVGLDPRAARQVRALMGSYAASGKAVLLTTHSMEVAEEVAERVLLIHRGEIAASGTLAELRREVGDEGARLETIFLQLTAERAEGRLGVAR